MEIVAGERRVKLSVREFAEFRIGPRLITRGPSGYWRARLGQEWHETLRETTSRHLPHACFEQVVKGFLQQGGWSFEMEGRIDQMVEENGRVRVTEVKTTTTPLPVDEKDLRDRFPHYFVQLACYLSLLEATHPKNHKPFDGEILFIDVAGGFPQTIPLEHDHKALFAEQANRILPFLEERRRGSERLRSLATVKPFEILRPGQKETIRELKNFGDGCPTLLFQAPTGFGKTGILLEFAFRNLKRGLYDRVLYLTGKATGQGEVVNHVRRMAPDGNLRYMQIRNQREHALDSSGRDARQNAEELNRRWLAEDIKPERLFKEGCVTLEKVRALGANTGIPPYEITRACLPYADLWVGDYNYVFQPSSARLIEDQQGHVPERTILIVDEAHNLPARVASSLSPCFDDGATARLRFELRELGNFKTLDELLGKWGRFLSMRRSGEVLDLDVTYDATDLLEQFSEILTVHPLPHDKLTFENFNLLWEYARAFNLLEDGSPRQMWAPDDGKLEIACLDASKHIEEKLSAFGLRVLTSATLEPIDEFAAECGLCQDSYEVTQGEAPWREGACRMAVDARVDTRFSSRSEHYQLTAETISVAAEKASNPVAAFFPSYRYAEEIYDLLSEKSGQSVKLQPRLTKLEERIAFLEDALENADVLLLILGSSFSESIDLLGGRIETALVIGPALPAVTALREARLESIRKGGREKAFRRVYQIPGMRKVNQAIGRLVRHPGHRAKVLLHGRRFTLNEYQNLLDAEYRDIVVFHDGDTLSHWLAEPLYNDGAGKDPLDPSNSIAFDSARQ